MMENERNSTAVQDEEVHTELKEMFKKLMLPKKDNTSDKKQ